jgi:hypothetical protein
MRFGYVISGLSLCENGGEYEKQDLNRQGCFGNSDFFAGNELLIGWRTL